MKLVENAKQAWKWLSMQMMVLALALQSTWELYSTEIQALLTPAQVTYVTIALLVLGIVGRLVKQTPDAAK